MTLHHAEATCAGTESSFNRGLCGKADPHVGVPDDAIPIVGSVATWKVVRAMRTPGSSRPHSFIVRRGTASSRIHHTQLVTDSARISVHDSLDLMTVAIDMFDQEKPRPQVSEKGAFYASIKGKTVAGIVTSVAKYGVFVSSTDLPFIVKGLVHKTKLAGYNKVAALKQIKVGDAITFCIDDFKQHPDSDRRIAGDWQVDCSQERVAYAEAFSLVEEADAQANTVCAIATVAGRSHRNESFLVEIILPSGGSFVARLKAPDSEAIHKGDRLQVSIDSVNSTNERPSAEATLVARLR